MYEMESCTEKDNQNKQQSNSRIFDKEGHLTTETIERIKAVIYGQCIGDAIGLLTEFMNPAMAKQYYGKYDKLEYHMKVPDHHRIRWQIGDWTDDSDQMILILESLTEDKGNVIPQTFASKLKNWVDHGFKELGDKSGCGIGRLTMDVIQGHSFETDPEKVSYKAWVRSDRTTAPNGGVMRTSILGVHQFWNTSTVMKNAVSMCKVTHYDPRCKASVVAVSVAISLMLKQMYLNEKKEFDVWKIIKESYKHACTYLDEREQKDELRWYMFCEDINRLQLAEKDSIGYTFKCVGAGFWAFKQDNFRHAIETVAMNAGDADTNAAVAGALLGCKLGLTSLPKEWLNGLCHKPWLDEKIERYLLVLEGLSMQVTNSQVITTTPVDTNSTVDNICPSNSEGAVRGRSPVDTTCLDKSPDDTMCADTNHSPVHSRNPDDTMCSDNSGIPVHSKNADDTMYADNSGIPFHSSSPDNTMYADTNHSPFHSRSPDDTMCADNSGIPVHSKSTDDTMYADNSGIPVQSRSPDDTRIVVDTSRQVHARTSVNIGGPVRNEGAGNTNNQVDAKGHVKSKTSHYRKKKSYMDHTTFF